MEPAAALNAGSERAKLSVWARETIRRKIIRGEYTLGEKLLEADLVAMLGVSKSPVREALLQLEREGLVELSPNRSARVFSMGATEIAELGELRLMLELQALRLAVQRNVSPLLAAMDGVIEQMRDALAAGDADAYKLLDYDYHHLFFEHCGNSYLEDIFKMLSFRVQALRNRLSRDEQLNHESLEDHIFMAEATAAGRVDDAAARLETHIAHTTRNYLVRLKADAAEKTGAARGQRTIRIACEEMERFAQDALAAAGVDQPTNDAVVKALMHASTLGVDTHGLRLLPHYLDAFAGGRVNRAPNMRLSNTQGGVCILDADDGHGALAAYAAVEKAIELAREHGLGASAIRNSSHFGAAGAYAIEIARAGLMGVVFCNSDSFVRLHGGAERFHGTNPIAAAAPVPSGDPWLMDMATSAIPFNRVQLSRSLGVPLPEDVASDGAGINTTDPERVEMLAPLGGAVFGYKGAGLAGLAEVFSSAFSDAPLSVELPPMISPDMSTQRHLGAFVLALDPAAFSGLDRFHAVLERYLSAIRGSKTSAGQRVLAPGDREWAEARQRRRNGIKLDAASVAALDTFAQEHSITRLRHVAEGA